MYFDKFPKIDYTFSNNNVLEVMDIFRKVSLSQESVNNSSIFVEILNGTGKKPETLAYEYYGNPEYSWLIFLANQTVNPSLDWNIDYEFFIKSITAKYTGSYYYIIENPNIQIGDIAINCGVGFEPSNPLSVTIQSVDTTRYCLVTEIDKEFRRFSGINFSNLGLNGNITFLRKNSEGKLRPLMNDTNTNYAYFRLDKIEIKKLTSPKYFKKSNLIISPYRIINPANFQLTDSTASFYTNNVYEPEVITDPNTLFNTLIYYHIFHPPNIMRNIVEKISFESIEIEEQNKKMKIKIIKPEFIMPIIELFNNTLNSNIVGRSQQIELNI